MYIGNNQVTKVYLGVKEITSALLGTLIINVNQVDYSTIIASLNLLTDTLDTAYDGTNPILAGMETDLDLINAEIITA